MFLSSSVQFSCSVVSDSLRTHGRQTSPSITNSKSLVKLMYIKSVMPSNHLILCHPLLLLLSIFPSIRVFSNESVLHIRWPKYWSFSFSISPSNEYSGPISFRIDWCDLLAVGILSVPLVSLVFFLFWRHLQLLPPQKRWTLQSHLWGLKSNSSLYFDIF